MRNNTILAHGPKEVERDDLNTFRAIVDMLMDATLAMQAEEAGSEPAFLRDVEPEQNYELLTILVQAMEQYGSFTDEARTDVAQKCTEALGRRITEAQAQAAFRWAYGSRALRWASSSVVSV